MGDLLLTSYLPIAGVSDSIFGIVPGNKNLSCFDRAMGTLDEITGFLDFLDNTGAENLSLTEHHNSARKEKPGGLPGINDVIPLTAEKMSSITFNLRNLPMPNTYSAGLLRTREGLHVFCHRLQAYIAEQRGATSQRLFWVQAQGLKFEIKHKGLWNANDSTWAFVPPNHIVLPIPAYEAVEVYQQEIHNAFDTSEAFLISINEDPLGSIRSDRKDGSKAWFLLRHSSRRTSTNGHPQLWKSQGQEEMSCLLGVPRWP